MGNLRLTEPNELILATDSDRRADYLSNLLGEILGGLVHLVEDVRRDPATLPGHTAPHLRVLTLHGETIALPLPFELSGLESRLVSAVVRHNIVTAVDLGKLIGSRRTPGAMADLLERLAEQGWRCIQSSNSLSGGPVYRFTETG
jgi:hypothetical protein